MFSILGITIIGIALVFWSLKSEPTYYREARLKLADPVVRKAAAEEFEQKAEVLEQTTRKVGDWSEAFTEEEINAYLMEEVFSEGKAKKPVRDPLIAFEEGVVRLGCYVETDYYTGVISVQTRPELLNEREIRLEVVDVQAGALSLPASRLLKEAVDRMQNGDFPLRWDGDSDSNSLILSLPEPRHGARPIQLTELKVTPGQVTLSGSTGE
ncbi:MAG: hypothetical protein R3C01_03830 [Planctomycetaceae bacterium]